MSYQYFKIYPTDEIISKVLHAFCLENLEDDKTFTRDDLVKNNVVENIYEIAHELEFFYFPHKVKWILTDLNEKSVINVLRHFVKTKGYMVYCFGNRKKEISYKIMKKNQVKEKNTFSVARGEFCLTFD